jgi:succinoglycan biosynthesis transport protein ExoP
MYMTDIIRAVIQRWRMVLSIFAAVMLFTIMWMVVTPREYRASAMLLFDTRAPDPMSEKGASASDQAAMLTTEAQILRSEIIARNVATKIGMDRDPATRMQWQQQTGGRQTYEGWLTRRVQSGLEVIASPTSNTIEISYRSLNPQKAAEMANAFAGAFNATRLAMSNEFSSRYAGWFRKRISASEARVEQAQAALAKFQRDHGIVATGAIDAESTRLSELSSKLSNAEANAADAAARAAGGAAMPDVQSSGVVQGLRAQIASKSAEIRQMSAELGPNHALMQAANAQMAQLQYALQQESAKTTGGLSTASGAAAANKNAIQSLLDQHRGRMLSLASDRGRLNLLESNAASARKEYEAETQQLAQLQAKSTIPSLNVIRLNAAEPPLLPNSPNLPVRFLMMTIVGLMLAIGAAVAMEWMQPRIRSRDAITYLTGVPVLGQADIRQIGRQLRLEGGKSV